MNKVFLIVEPECHDIEKENQYIWGRKNGMEYGIRHILALSKQYNIPINFFVDFAKESLLKIVNTIEEYVQPVFYIYILILYQGMKAGHSCGKMIKKNNGIY